MGLKTRGSAALDKAQRRLPLIKSIDENLDLGYGLSVAGYTDKIAEMRTMLEAHNTLLSELEESRKTLNQMEKTLSDLSGRMLSGVATRYGKNSIQYLKAGGSNRPRSSQAVVQDSTPTASFVPSSL
jgi:hypothetical protein